MSRIAQLDVRLYNCGDSAPIKTISDKQVVAVNKYFLSAEFSEQDAVDLFKWARNSEEAKKANEIQNEFPNKVKIVKLAATCRLHGGSVTPSNMHLLDELNEKQ